MMITIRERPVIVGYASSLPIYSEGVTYDVSRYLIAGSEVELTQERERDAFERVVSDVKLELSRMDGYIDSILGVYKSPNIWDVNIFDGRRLFWGAIKSPLTKDHKEKKYVVRAFAIDRAWIDFAKTTGMPAFTNSQLVYTTVEDILARLLLGEGRPLTQLGVTTIEVDTIYKKRPIRDGMLSSDPDIGNNGRFENLDSSHTVKDVLDAMAIYYNAEFLVDPESGKFRMRQRKTFLNDTGYSLDDAIMSESSIEEDDTDQKKYDYIKLTVAVPKPAQAEQVYVDSAKTQAVYAPLNYPLLESGKVMVYYRYSNVVNVSGVEIETELSDSWGMEYVLDGQHHFIKAPVFEFPAPPSGTVRQNVYRLYNDEAYRLYQSFQAGSTLQFFIDPGVIDIHGIEKFFIPIDQSGKVGNGISYAPTGNIYLSFDEVTGTWDSAIIEEGGTSAPQDGTIFEVNPMLRFYDGYSRTVKPYSIIEAFQFFGNETDTEEFKYQWIDLFTTHPLFRLTAKGTNYTYGDTFASSKKLPGKFVVKKAVNKFMAKNTQLELIKL